MQIIQSEIFWTLRPWSNYLEIRGNELGGAIDVAGLIAVASSARYQRSCPERTPPFSATEETRDDFAAENNAAVNVSVLAAVFVKTRGIPDTSGVAFVNRYTVGESTGRSL